MRGIFKKSSMIRILLLAAAAASTLFVAYAVFGGLSGPDVVKLNPAGVSIDSSGSWVESDAAWALFDRDTAIAYAPAATANILVTLPAATDISAVKVYDSAAYNLAVYEDTSGAWKKVPGLESISLKNQTLSWNAFAPAATLHAGRLRIELTPAAGGNAGGVKEIEIWGSEGGDPGLSLGGVQSATDAKGILAVTPRPAHIMELVAAPQSIDVPADGNVRALTFTLSTDPKLVKRAFILYDAYNAEYLINPEKNINGGSWTGGFVTPVGVPQWTSHVEEISPSWLVRGRNTVEFRNLNLSSDPSSYFIRDLKVLVEYENGWNTLAAVSGIAENASHSAKAANDGDLGTYYELKSSHTFDLKAERTVQPDTIKLNLWSASSTPSGTITLQYLQGTVWKNFTSGGTIDMSTLHNGWNDIKIPTAVSTDSLRLNIQVTPDKRRQNATVGGINEVELIASPIGSRSSRGLVVTFPNSGEYFGRTAHIQGFVEPVATVSIEGKLSSNSDGAISLSLTKDETRFASQADSEPWEAVVTASPGGVALTKTISLTRGLSAGTSPTRTEDSSQAAASSKEKYSEKVAPGQAKTIKYKGVTLDIPAGAVDKETEITIIPLTEADLARLNPGMINVTYPDAGYRFLPHGMTFKVPIKISFGYSKQLFAAAQKDEEVNMYFYDESLLRWVGLKKLRFDAAQSFVESESDHFTDIINSTLVVPEHPQALSFNPNSIKDIKAADPSAGMDLIEPPRANNTGTANLSYPIEIPRGRGAYTPDLRITYSSNNANGWMGLGWDIPIPSIQVDTRWGVPIYNPSNETESYLLAGQALAPVYKWNDATPTARTTDRRFYKRVEGDFLKIVRKGNGPANYSWEVTDKAGIRYYYGLTAQARLADYQAGNVFQWFLEKVVDTNGNVTLYTYYKDTKEQYMQGISNPANPPHTSLAGEDWVYLYLDRIDYTANEKTAATPKYSVVFHRDKGERKDLIVGGKSGFKTAQRFRLDSVEVKYDSTTIRTYAFTYEEGDFAKSLLNKITAKGANGTSFYSHSFDYYRMPKGTDGVYAGFAPTEVWNSPSSDVLSRVEEDTHSRNRYRGLSVVPHRSNSVGKISGYTNAESDTKSKLQDINGDGLPDLVFKNAVHYNLSGPEGQLGFSDAVGVPGLNALEVESSRTDHRGWAVYVNAIVAGGSYSDDRASSVSRSSATMSDIDGDGFTDLVSGTSVAFNRGTGIFLDNGIESRQFIVNPDWSHSSDVDLSGIEGDAKDSLHLADAVRKWVAPFAGDIRIIGTVQKKHSRSNTESGQREDGVKLYIYKNSALLGQEIVIGPNDTTVHLLGEAVGSAGSDSIVVQNVQAHDRIYFRLSSVDNGENDDILFDPVITYESAGGQSVQSLPILRDVTGRPLYTYRASTDFSQADFRQGEWVAPHKGLVNFSAVIKKFKTPDDVRVIFKRTTSPDAEMKDVTAYRIYSFPADTIDTRDLSETLDVEEGERFLFSVESDRPIDVSAVEMSAELVYTATKKCRLADDFSHLECPATPVDDPDAVDAEGNLLYRFKPQINYPFFLTVPNVSAQTWVAPYSGTISVRGAVSRHANSSAFSAYILGVNRLIWKQQVAEGGPPFLNELIGDPETFPHNITLTVNRGDQLFFEVRSKAQVEGSVTWSPVITYSQYCDSDDVITAVTCSPVTCTTDPDTGAISCDHVNPAYPGVQFYYHDTSTAEAFGGGFRQWYFGQWNGNNAWDETKIRRPRGKEDDEALDFFVRMAPVAGGVPNSEGQPVWTALEQRCFIGAASLASSRVAADVSYAQFGTGGIVRMSTGNNRISSASFSIILPSLSATFSDGNTNTLVDIFDFNGDRYPDQIRPSGVTLNDGVSGFTEASPAIPSTYRTIYNDNVAFNLGVGTTVNALTSGGSTAHTDSTTSASTTGSVMDFIMVSFGVGFADGDSTTKLDLIDINGDGLPDKVYQGNPSALAKEDVQIVKVQLNLGDRFGSEELWYLPGWSRVMPDSVEQHQQSRGIPFIVSSPIRESENRSVSMSLGADIIGYAGASVSVGLSAVRHEIDMMDVNGDGLPDHVSKFSNDDFLRVKINQGGSFGEEQKWSLPSWDVVSPIDDVWSFAILGIGGDYIVDQLLFGNDTLSNTVTESYSTGYFANVPILLIPPIFGNPPLWLILGWDNSAGSTTVKSQVSFSDMDGDGLPDHVYKNGHEYLFHDNNQHLVQVKRNAAGKANLLKAVKRPLGGSFTLDYERKGNKVDYRNSSQIIDMPHSQWVLSRVTLKDGMKNSKNVKNEYVTDYTYNSGYYSRSEREFYGFHTVTETRGKGSDTATVVQAYENQNFYRKGLLLASETRSGSATGPIYVATENQYGLRDETVTESKFPYLTKTITNFYHVGNQTVAKTTSQEYTSYDNYGNILDYVDRADEGAADDVFASIRYDNSNQAEYILNRPVSIEVKNSSNTLFRSRSASYERGTGNLKSLSMLVRQGTNADWIFDYYDDGNLKTITYPAGDPSHNAKASGYYLAYTYDTPTATYVTAITDAFDYASSAEYDYRFGQPVWTQDINGQNQVNVYDDFGRFAAAYGPYDVNGRGVPAGVTPTLGFEYTAAVLAAADGETVETPARAVTRNKAASRMGGIADTLDTVTFVDGMKRVVQTRKEAEVNGAYGVVASGPADYDTLGRVVEQGQPAFLLGKRYDYARVTMANPNKFAYDTLDRTVMVQTPDTKAPGGYAVTTTEYDFAVSPGGAYTMFKTTVEDPNYHFGGGATGRGIKISYKDVHDKILAVVERNKGQNIVTTYAYDLLGQITTVVDAKGNPTTVVYDLLGRRLSIDNRDTGLTSYTYDANGNVTTKETANLRTGAKKISYNYDYNRLVKIDYPESADVTYEYGAATEKGDAHGNLAGRIKKVIDESGAEERWYGRLGEVTKELRQVNASNNPVASKRYETQYVFDSFGRMLQMTYPDGEELYYTYDAGGLLKKAEGMKRQNKYSYVKNLVYDEYGQRTSITYGNNVVTTYSYDQKTRRLARLVTIEPTKGRIIQNLRYDYDLVGNIMTTNNTAPVPQGGELGGPTEQNYTYDDLYQLIAANGVHTPAPNKRTQYTNNLEYDIIGNITRKVQAHLVITGTDTAQEPRETNYGMDYLYKSAKPHAVTEAGDKLYAYDLNGNMTGWTSKTTNAKRTITWNEENRVKEVRDSGNGTTFLYDDSGERVIKRGGGNESVYLNRFYSLKNGDLGSKHIFAGETRVVTKLEKDGGSLQSGIPGSIAFANSQGLQNAILSGSGQKKGINRRLPNPDGTTTLTNHPPIEKFEFFYHGDHLGSSSYITDDAGAVYQHLEYFPYGETWVEDGGSGQMPYYRFTGKELDPETGLYYYGARYYDPVLSRWISADPILGQLLDGKPYGGAFIPINLNLHSYTANNPVIYRDPDGNFRINHDWTIDIFWTEAWQLNNMAYREMTTAWSEGSYVDASVGALLWAANGVNLDLAFVAQGIISPINAPLKYAHGMYTENYSEAQLAGAEFLLTLVFIKMALPPEVPKTPAATTTRVAASGTAASTVARSLENPSSLKGATVEEVKSLIPKDWKASPTSSGGGMRYANPARRGEQVRTMPGNPKDPTLVKQGPYVRVSQGGVKSEPIPLEGNPTLKK